MSRMQGTIRSLVLLMPMLVATCPAVADDAQSLVSGTATKSTDTSINLATGETAALPDDDIRQLFELYREARSSSMPDEADTLAKRIVEVSIRDNGTDSLVTAVALTNLANFQSSTEDNTSAVQNYARAIDIVERTDSRLSSDLITPLRGMGSAYLRAGDADKARDAWLRALHISHVNFGPHNFEQVETLYWIGRMFRNAGMYKEASKVQKRVTYLHRRVTETGEISHTP